MKLYRLAVSVFPLLCLMFFAPSAFALTARAPMESIEETYEMYSEYPEEEISERDIQLAQQALQAGMQTYQAHAFTEQLTEQDKLIEHILDEQFPAILNKIKTSVTEVEEELNAASLQLAEAIIANQTLYPRPNMEVASVFAAMTGLQYALLSGSVNENVMEILVQQSMSELEKMLNEEEK